MFARRGPVLRLNRQQQNNSANQKHSSFERRSRLAHFSRFPRRGAVLTDYSQVNGTDSIAFSQHNQAENRCGKGLISLDTRKSCP
jgi:hypothetical protein